MAYHQIKTGLLCTIFIVCSLAATPLVSANQDTFQCSTADGYAIKTDADYETARDAVTADSIDDAANSLYIGQNSGWEIRRSFFYVDTSDLPNNALVYKAHLYFTVADLPNNIGLYPVQALTAPSSPLATDDYHRSQYTTEAWSQAITSTGLTSLVLHDERDPQGRDGLVISKTGMTKFAVFASADKEYGGGTPADTNFIRIRSADTAAGPYITVEYNEPPATPLIVSAPDSEYQNNYVAITVMTTDPDGDDVQYKVDWGNSHTSDWSSPAESGTEKILRYKYESVGNYDIKVKARDAAITSDGTYYDNRENAVWSSTHAVETTQYYSTTEPDPANFDIEDEDQAITGLHATFADGDEEGTNALHVWWDLSIAAQADPGLRLSLAVETLEGEDLIDTVPAWKYADSRNPYRIEDWNSKYADGTGRWNFVLKTTLINPSEPEEADEGNNYYDLRFIFGFPLTFEIQFIGMILLVLLVALIIWKRKSIFYKFYTDYKNIPDEEELDKLNIGKDLKKQIRKLRQDKERYGKTADPLVGWFKKKTHPAKVKYRKGKMQAEKAAEEGKDKFLTLFPQQVGPHSPLRKPPSYATEAEKEAYRNAWAQAIADKDEKIGTGLFERLFYPDDMRRTERIVAQANRQAREKVNEQKKKRSKAARKGWEKRKKKKEPVLRKLKIQHKKPKTKNERQVEKLAESTLEKERSQLQNFLNEVYAKIAAEEKGTDRAEELVKLAEDANEQLEFRNKALSEKRAKTTKVAVAPVIGRSLRSQKDTIIDSLKSVKKKTVKRKTTKGKPTQIVLDEDNIKTIEEAVTFATLREGDKQGFIEQVKQGPGHFKESELDKRINALNKAKKATRRLLKPTRTTKEGEVLDPHQENRLQNLLDIINAKISDLSNFSNKIEKIKSGSTKYNRRSTSYRRKKRSKPNIKHFKKQKKNKKNKPKNSAKGFDITWW